MKFAPYFGIFLAILALIRSNLAIPGVSSSIDRPSLHVIFGGATYVSIIYAYYIRGDVLPYFNYNRS
jgi:hypothetical protein